MKKFLKYSLLTLTIAITAISLNNNFSETAEDESDYPEIIELRDI